MRSQYALHCALGSPVSFSELRAPFEVGQAALHSKSALSQRFWRALRFGRPSVLWLRAQHVALRDFSKLVAAGTSQAQALAKRRIVLHGSWLASRPAWRSPPELQICRTSRQRVALIASKVFKRRRANTSRSAKLAAGASHSVSLQRSGRGHAHSQQRHHQGVADLRRGQQYVRCQLRTAWALVGFRRGRARRVALE